MNQIQEMRITFVCPVKNIVTVATRIENIVDGDAVVVCGVCNNFHVIETKAEDTSCRLSLKRAFKSLEKELGEIRSFDGP